MAYICEQLTQPDINGYQTCILWVEQGFLGLPEITVEQAGQLCTAIAFVFVAAWGFKKLAQLIKTI